MNGANPISPLRAEALVKAPDPHHPDQTVMFPSAVDTSFATPGSPMTMNLAISLHRVIRQKCDGCQKRRVCFFVGLGVTMRGPIMCAKCSGIR